MFDNGLTFYPRFPPLFSMLEPLEDRGPTPGMRQSKKSENTAEGQRGVVVTQRPWADLVCDN